MAEEKNKQPEKRISESQRFRYIGFEVFPDQPKELFDSDSEKKRLEDINKLKREQGNILRENCTLLEERVSSGDRIVMMIASAAIVIALFLPWYSAYNVIEEEVASDPVALVDSLEIDVDSLAQDQADSLALIPDDSLTALAVAGPESQAEGDQVEPVQAEQPKAAVEERRGVYTTTNEEGEEVIIGLHARKKIHKEFDHLSGIGALVSIGSVGGPIFSSGFILMLTALVFMIYTLLCLGLPAYTMYTLLTTKGSDDTKALALKKTVKYSWIPVIMFVAALMFSFIGAEYGFNAGEYYTSLGDAYGTGTLLETLSWGILVSLFGFILIAVKGSEI